MYNVRKTLESGVVCHRLGKRPRPNKSTSTIIEKHH
jgi:hypothetical protein